MARGWFLSLGTCRSRSPPAISLRLMIGKAAVLAHLVDRHDLGMVEPGDRLGLDAEPVDRVGIILEGGGPDRLERHDPAELLLPGFENDPHPAAGDLFDQLEVAEIGACFDRAIRAGALARVGRRLVATVILPRQERAGQALESIFVGEERQRSSARSAWRARTSARSGGRPARTASRYSAMARSSLCSRSESAGVGPRTPAKSARTVMPRSTQVRASSCSRRCLRPRFRSPATALVRPIESGADFGQRASLPVVQDECLALTLGKPLQRVGQQDGLLVPLRVLAGRWLFEGEPGTEAG